MRLSASVKLEGRDPVIVDARPADILKWEVGTKRKITDGMGYGDMLHIIHSAALRSGVTTDSFNDWVVQLEDFEPQTPDGDPTQTGQSAE